MNLVPRFHYIFKRLFRKKKIGKVVFGSFVFPYPNSDFLILEKERPEITGKNFIRKMKAKAYATVIIEYFTYFRANHSLASGILSKKFIINLLWSILEETLSTATLLK